MWARLFSILRILWGAFLVRVCVQTRHCVIMLCRDRAGVSVSFSSNTDSKLTARRQQKNHQQNVCALWLNGRADLLGRGELKLGRGSWMRPMSRNGLKEGINYEKMNGRLAWLIWNWCVTVWQKAQSSSRPKDESCERQVKKSSHWRLTLHRLQKQVRLEIAYCALLQI